MHVVNDVLGTQMLKCLLTAALLDDELNLTFWTVITAMSLNAMPLLS